MKNSLLKIMGLALLMGSLVMSCSSPQEKVADAKENLIEAKQDLAQADRDSAEAAEWAEFKAAAQEKMAANSRDIAALREKKSKAGVFMDPVYGKQIMTLEERTITLQTRIDDYEKYHSNWSVFKREFDHDLEELGNTLKDISKDTQK